MPTSPILLALNVGSSSLKASTYRFTEGNEPTAHVDLDWTGGATGIGQLLPQLVDGLSLHCAPAIVGHRIVHGGLLDRPALLDDALCSWLDGYGRMAPLHQPAALELVRVARNRWPEARQVGAFDTTWHARLAPWSRRLPVEQSLHDAGVMRYGFHGLAYQSVLRQLRRAAPALACGRLVLAHLGGGSSLCAVDDGRSIDTTMGMSPLDGLPMATRPGALDPAVPMFMREQMRMSSEQVSQSLWQRSGLLGIAGSSGDMRYLLAHAGEPSCRDAIDCYVMRTAQGIAAMATALGGIDALVYSGGIGNGADEIRRRIGDKLAWLGLQVDPVRNASHEARIHCPGSGIECWQIDADEQLELLHAARDCVPA